MNFSFRLGVEMVVDRRVVKRRDGEGWSEERKPFYLVKHQVVSFTKSHIEPFGQSISMVLVKHYVMIM